LRFFAAEGGWRVAGAEADEGKVGGLNCFAGGVRAVGRDRGVEGGREEEVGGFEEAADTAIGREGGANGGASCENTIAGATAGGHTAGCAADIDVACAERVVLTFPSLAPSRAHSAGFPAPLPASLLLLLTLSYAPFPLPFSSVVSCLLVAHPHPPHLAHNLPPSTQNDPFTPPMISARQVRHFVKRAVESRGTRVARE
jgi:hypothetical protein